MGKKSVPVVLTSKEGAALAFNRAARDGTQTPYLRPKKGKWEDGMYYKPNESKQEKRRREYMDKAMRTKITITKNVGKIEDEIEPPTQTEKDPEPENTNLKLSGSGTGS